MDYQTNYTIHHGVSSGLGTIDHDDEQHLQQTISASTLERACELAYENLYRHAENYLPQTTGKTTAQLTALIGEDHVPFATIADILNRKARTNVQPQRINNVLGITVAMDVQEKHFYRQFKERMIWRDGEKIAEEQELIAPLRIWVCDQGHYGTTSCGHCGYDFNEQDSRDHCPDCGYKMGDLEVSY